MRVSGARGLQAEKTGKGPEVGPCSFWLRTTASAAEGKCEGLKPDTTQPDTTLGTMVRT